MADLIDRQVALDEALQWIEAVYFEEDNERERKAICQVIGSLVNIPPALSEPLTDTEQRIFLAAMGREEKVCKKVDDEYKDSYENNLVRVCHEITRKVKKALWTN